MSGRKNSSVIWNYFTVLSSSDKTAQCDLCTQKISFKGSITNLKAHLNRRHPTIDLKLELPANRPQLCEVVEPSQPKVGICQSDDINGLISCGSDKEVIDNELAGPSTSGCKPIILPPRLECSRPTVKQQTTISTFIPKKINVSQQKKCDSLLLNLFTQDFQPFSIVEDKGFKNFVTALNPSYKIPSRKVLSNNFLPAAYEKCKNEVKGTMLEAQSVCLTTDCWSSSTNESYLALTAHFVSDSFTLESVLLDCSQIEGSHTADHLADTIKRITDEYNISEKIILVVSDNAPNIVAAVNKLKWRHFGCYAHTINLVVQNALLIVHEIRERAKNIVSFYKRSNLATEKLLKYQKDTGVGQPKKVIQDVVTRWNSTYYMCQRLVLLQDAVKTSLALCEKPELNLTAEEWKILSELVHVLAPFEAITRQISGEGYVTGSLVIVITAGLLNVCSELLKKPFHKTVLQTVSDLKTGIEKRLQNIEFSKTAGICTFLDPRFKLHGFTVDMAKCNIKKEITELVTKEINLNKRKMAHEGDNPQAKKSRTVEEINELSVWGYIDNIMENQPETNSTSSAVIEVQRYLDERAIGRKEDPLKWWAENHHHYPNLSKLFKSKFAMVATSVPCERVFSKTGLLLSERRTRLKSKKVKEIIFLSANSK